MVCRSFILSLMVLTVAFFGPVGRVQAAWDLHKVDGRDYVTLQNVSDFYKFTGRTVSGRNIRLTAGQRSLQVTLNSKELFINGIKFLLSYPVVEHQQEVLISRMDLSKLIEPVLRPSKIVGADLVKTVILDPGHGGHDGGAKGSWGMEKDFNLDVAKRARNLLLRKGYQVKMTRSDDRFIPLAERASFANKHRNAVFVSIHFNSSHNRAASGIETFVLAPRGVPSFAQNGPRVSDFQLCRGNALDAENMALATAMHASMIRRLRMPDRGIKRARFLVIREVAIPGVLLEGGFLSNARDARMVASSNYRQQMANSIVEAISNYRKAVRSGSQQQITRTVQNESSPSIVVKPN